MYHYLDVFKDINLFLIVYNLNGGWQSLVRFPTYFTSMIVYCLGLSVFGPIIMGSVYLITSNNYKILIRPLNIKTTNILGIFWIKIGVLLCSFINPLVIRALYEYRKEMTRRYARQIDSIAVKYLTKMKEVKSQYTHTKN